jgi:maleylpyruvate isomerase
VPPPTEAELAGVDDALSRVMAAVEAMSDDEARQPSRLPGWTRGHVMTHLARNADGLRNLAEGALAHEERVMYPGGAEQRAADIDAGAARPVDELRDDLAQAHATLVETWTHLSADEYLETDAAWLAEHRSW